MKVIIKSQNKKWYASTYFISFLFICFMVICCYCYCVSFNSSNYVVSLKDAQNTDIGKIYDSSVRRSNYSRILYGNKDTAVILIHGFLSSPFEVYFLGQRINDNGFTVFMPLIDGFGGSTALANQMKYENWRSALGDCLNLLYPSYSKIVVMGFSLGGTIVSDFLINNVLNYKKVIGAILLAPYYELKICRAELIIDFVNLFRDSIPLTTLYKISRNEDLMIPISNPDHYNSDMPTRAVKELIKFGKILRDQQYSKKIYVPTLLIYTEDDQTVNNLTSIEFTKKMFTNLKIIKFPKDKKVRHQFALPTGNREFDFFCNSVIGFIEELDDDL